MHKHVTISIMCAPRPHGITEISRPRHPTFFLSARQRKRYDVMYSNVSRDLIFSARREEIAGNEFRYIHLIVYMLISLLFAL